MEIQNIETTEHGVIHINCILIHDNELIGIGNILNYLDDNTCVLSGLIIKEEHRGNNYSLLLQNHRELICKNRFSAKKCFLFCPKKRGLRDLYKKRGYKYYSKHEKNGQIWMMKNIRKI